MAKQPKSTHRNDDVPFGAGLIPDSSAPVSPVNDTSSKIDQTEPQRGQSDTRKNTSLPDTKETTSSDSKEASSKTLSDTPSVRPSDAPLGEPSSTTGVTQPDASIHDASPNATPDHPDRTTQTDGSVHINKKPLMKKIPVDHAITDADHINATDPQSHVEEDPTDSSLESNEHVSRNLVSEVNDRGDQVVPYHGNKRKNLQQDEYQPSKTVVQNEQQDEEHNETRDIHRDQYSTHLDNDYVFNDTWDTKAMPRHIAGELRHIEERIIELLKVVEPRRKRRLDGTRRWLDLQDDITKMRHSGRIEESVVREIHALCAKRHRLFQRLNYLVSTRPVWNS